MPPKLSEEEIELLTEEEREGLEDDELVDEGHDEEDDSEEAAKPADEPPAKPDLNPGDGGDDEAANTEATKAAADQAAADAAAAAQPEQEAAAPTPPPSQMPRYEAPADAKEKLAEIERQREALATKFDEGELTAAEYRAQSRPLEDQRDTLKEQMFKASLSQDALVHTWSKIAVPAFLERHPEYAPGTPLYDALDAEVRRLQAGSDNPLDPALLAKADATIKAQMRKAMGIAETQPPATPTTPPKKEGKGRVIPPTLAHVPAADITEDGDGGEFAYLDRLSDQNPLAYENALAKLSDEQRERYLAS